MDGMGIENYDLQDGKFFQQVLRMNNMNMKEKESTTCQMNNPVANLFFR